MPQGLKASFGKQGSERVVVGPFTRVVVYEMDKITWLLFIKDIWLSVNIGDLSSTHVELVAFMLVASKGFPQSWLRPIMHIQDQCNWKRNGPKLETCRSAMISILNAIIRLRVQEMVRPATGQNSSSTQRSEDQGLQISTIPPNPGARKAGQNQNPRFLNRPRPGCGSKPMVPF